MIWANTEKEKKTTTQGEGENDVVDAGDAPAWNAEKKKNDEQLRTKWKHSGNLRSDTQIIRLKAEAQLRPTGTDKSHRAGEIRKNMEKNESNQTEQLRAFAILPSAFKVFFLLQWKE